MTGGDRAVFNPRDEYCRVRTLTEAIAEPLTAEDQTVQTMADVSPTKWHRAHVTWFFETFVMERFAPGYRVHDEKFGYLFNSYYEAVGARHPRPQRGLVTRPGIAEVRAYREHVDGELLDFAMCGMPDDVRTLVRLGLHHEQQHQELMVMDAKHVLGSQPFGPAYREGIARAPERRTGTPAEQWHRHPGGIVEIGVDSDPMALDDPFVFDNETPRHEVLVEPFEISARLVTCGDWIAFLADGGYDRADLWMMEGWITSREQGWRAPLYWQQDDDGGWETYTLGGRRAVDPDEPVCHVSWFEADAFARWAGCRLPTEQEWETVAPATVPAGAHLDLERLHPTAGRVGDGQWYGEVWQWTASPYVAYPRFRPAEGAIGEYNGKFMVNQQVLRGSCCATPPGHARRTYRNFFPASSRWAFSGLRLAR